MQNCETFSFSCPTQITAADRERAIPALEDGRIVFLPKFTFELKKHEDVFLSPEFVDPKSKNISYNIYKDHLSGCKIEEGGKQVSLKEMLKRYAHYSKKLVETLFPYYITYLKQGRTSFRPVEAHGRDLSKRKDDTRLHVDAFQANPVKGARILRVFTNVNPYERPRIWHVGEPFESVVEKMKSRLKGPWPGAFFFLKLFKITKSKRTLYDHYMLKMHDIMKKDDAYQNHVIKKEIRFPAQSTWVVFTDQVSHAALSGQFLFEQTFYLPIMGQKFQEKSPLKILERTFQKSLIP